MNFKELKLEEIKGLKIGHASNDEAKTGVTVLYFENGGVGGVDVSGGGPASRETPLLSPITADNKLNAVVLSGGSAYGLAASDGVMTAFEEAGIGFETGFAKVPLVCQSCIYDLSYGAADVRPDKAMGYEACKKALEATDSRQGNVGAGAGASVGKIYGMKAADKAGLGTYFCGCNQIPGFYIGAIVVVNAFGDIYDPDSHEKIAGAHNAERTEFRSTKEGMYDDFLPRNAFTANTTIGAIVTNASFNKAQMNKIASMARNAYARCIDPVGTMLDGDTIYAVSVESKEIESPILDINFVGSLAADVMGQAIKNAILNSKISDEEYLSNIKA
jgi:L-aminopeptidase/D-esterase-like protein